MSATVLKEGEIPTQREVFPEGMAEVSPPDGTIIFQHGQGAIRFGVSSISHGLLRTFEEEPNSPTDYVKGTLIVYNPGYITINVKQQGLSAEQINKIGQLSVHIDRTFHLLHPLPRIVGQTQSLIDDLETMAFATSDLSKNVETSIRAQVDSLGTIIDQQQESKTKLERDYLEFLEEANRNGIMLIKLSPIKGLADVPTIPVPHFLKQHRKLQATQSTT